MIKLSIVIPIYNVESYIQKSLESIMAQTITENIECILIDDCGNDNSIPIAKQTIDSYKGDITFSIIHHNQNRGLSCARNTGIKAAKGEYIWFVDSDDSIVTNAIEQILKELDNNDNIDILTIGIVGVKETNKVIDKTFHCNIPNDIGHVKHGYEWLSDPLFNRGPMQIFILNKNFIMKNSLYFVEGLFHEDLEYAPRMLIAADKVKVIANNLYIYLLRNTGSITTSINPKRFTDILCIINRHENLINKLSNINKIKAMKWSQFLLTKQFLSDISHYNEPIINLSINPNCTIIRKQLLKMFWNLSNTRKFKALIYYCNPNLIYKYKW